MCNVWTKECSWVQCASNEEKIKQREDKVFVAISESRKISTRYTVYCYTWWADHGPRFTKWFILYLHYICCFCFYGRFFLRLALPRHSIYLFFSRSPKHLFTNNNFNMNTHRNYMSCVLSYY